MLIFDKVLVSADTEDLGALVCVEVVSKTDRAGHSVPRSTTFYWLHALRPLNPKLVDQLEAAVSDATVRGDPQVTYTVASGLAKGRLRVFYEISSTLDFGAYAALDSTLKKMMRPWGPEVVA